jgi:hypothetical protein
VAVTQNIFLNITGNAFLHHLNISKDLKYIFLAAPTVDFSLGHENAHNSKGEGKALVYNVLKSKIESEIPLPTINHDVIFQNERTELWTQDISHSAKIRVYGLGKNKQKEISIGSDPTEILFAKNESLCLYASSESAFLSIIDTYEKETIKEVKVDPYPTGLYKGLTDRDVIVCNAVRRSLNFVNLDSYKVYDFIDLNFEPGQALFTKTDEIWILDTKGNQVQVFQKKNGIWTKFKALETGKDPHAISLWKDKIWIVNQKSNSISVFNVNEYSLIKTLNTGFKPNDIKFYGN